MADRMKPTILIQLDTDPQPSVFDAVVAHDSGAEHLLRHGGVTPGQVRDLVYGALFTRGGDDLRRTAIFVGGSDVAAAEAVFLEVTKTFFGGFRVSTLFDANGSNTTAAAAVLTALEASGGSLEGVRSAVLAGTGPVGQRVARLLAKLGARVALGSRSHDRARSVAERIGAAVGAEVHPFSADGPEATAEAITDAALLISAGAPGITLLQQSSRRTLRDLKIAIDLNAVPPPGIEGLEAVDRGVERDGVRCWGALGVGATKMRIHKAALRALFTANDKLLDAEQVLEIGRSLT